MSRMIWHGDRITGKLNSQATRVTRGIIESIAATARKLCPVKSGDLRDTIKVTTKGITVGNDTTVDYAADVELGTATRAANPFMRPAIEQFSDEDLERIVKIET